MDQNLRLKLIFESFWGQKIQCRKMQHFSPCTLAPILWLEFCKDNKKSLRLLRFCMRLCVFEGILKCHLVQKSVIYSHGSRYCDEFQSKSRKISLVSYRTSKGSIIKIFFPLFHSFYSQDFFCIFEMILQQNFSLDSSLAKMLLLPDVCCQIRPKPSSGFSLFFRTENRYICCCSEESEF